MITILPMPMVTRSCPLCGSQNTSRIFAEANFDIGRLDSFTFASRKVPEYMHYRFVVCPLCDLLYANPLPIEDILANSYSEAAYDSAEESWYAAATYASFLPDIIRSLPDRHGTLDIGTGDGAFLEHLLAHGFDGVVGVEPSRAPVAIAKENVRSLIRIEMFRPEDFTPASFSLITCFQTLEHLYDPMAMCYSAFNLLKPGGAIFLVCHDRRAPLNRILNRRSPIFDVEHLQLFSPGSTRFLLKEVGFADVSVRTVVNRYPLRYWLRLFPLPLRMKSMFISLLNRIGVGRVPVPLPVGNLAIIGYKPQRA